jgi:hypothetical protein
MSETVDQVREIRARVNQLWTEEHQDCTVIVARYWAQGAQAGQSIPDNTVTIVDFNGLMYDTHSAVTTGAAWHFHAPANGYYAVSAAIMFGTTTTWADGEEGALYLYKNGGPQSYLARKDNYNTASLFMQLTGSDVVFLSAAEYIDIRVIQISGAALALHNDAGWNYVAIHKV